MISRLLGFEVIRKGTLENLGRNGSVGLAILTLFLRPGGSFGNVTILSTFAYNLVIKPGMVFVDLCRDQR